MNQPPDPDLNLNRADPNGESFSDDSALVNFLQRYQPEVPESSPDLEDRILHAVLDEVTQSPSVPHHQASTVPEEWRIAKWSIPAAIAAMLTLFWGGSQIWRTAKQPIPPDGDLEAFVAESWSGPFDPFNEIESDLLTDPSEWWGQQPASVMADANTHLCKRTDPCHE